MFDFTKAQVAEYFQLLSKALENVTLERYDGTRSKATADEFMLMQVANGYAGFKHCDSRNYVHLRLADNFLWIPKTEKAFARGIF